jgi:mannosidase alpha-like ER degradation enhancer 2
VLALGDDVHRAAELQDSSYKMWNLAGIEPETLDYAKMQITSPNYELRPEIIESTYYLYHYTHDTKYLAMGRTYLDGLVKYCRTDEAYAALADVRTKQKRDSMESFFFAETLKYLYLLFAPESTLEFDSVVFNTEAHPMKRSLGLKAGGLNGADPAHAKRPHEWGTRRRPPVGPGPGFRIEGLLLPS